LTIPAVPSRTLRPGWILAAATGIYFLVFRGSRIHRRHAGVFPAKELVIGTVFAFGVLLAARGSAGLDSAPALLGAMTLLFTGNCLLIARTEAVSDRTRDEAAYFSGTGSCHHLPEGFLAASAGLALVLDPSIHEIGTLAVAISAGATLAVSPTLSSSHLGSSSPGAGRPEKGVIDRIVPSVFLPDPALERLPRA
jgi:hypothetical protein